MKIDLRKVDDVVIVDFDGSLVAGVGDEVLSEVIEELLAEEYKKILLNLSTVDYIDSMGLGELVQCLKASQASGATLKLLRPQERVRKTLHLSMLLPLFKIYDTELEALTSFGAEA